MSFGEFWIVAGPNGAGKSTLVQKAPIRSLLPHVVFLDPDDVTLRRLRQAGLQGFADAPEADLLEAYRAAADEVFAGVASRLETGQAAGVETVLSTEKYRPLVDRVLARGGFVGLIYVWLDAPELACARVERRAGEGGHDVPPQKVAARWHRSVENLGWFLRRVSRFWIYDNSDSDPSIAPRLLAAGGHGTTENLAPTLPRLLASVLPPATGP